MAELFGFLAVLLWFAAAFFVFRSPYGSRLWVASFVIFGVNELVWLLPTWDIVDPDVPRRLIPYSGFVGLVLLVIGAVRLGGGKRSAGSWRSGRGSTYINTLDSNMASLIIPRNASNSYSSAEALRNQLYDRMEEISRGANLSYVAYKSHIHSGKVWAQFDYRLPQDDANLSLRSSIRITVERFDYHRYEHSLTLEVIYGARSKVKAGFVDLAEPDLQALVHFVHQGGRFPRLRSRRVRRYPFQLWRPRNKVTKLRKDWVTIGLVAGIAIAIPIPVVGWLFALALGITLAVFTWRRRTYVLTTGKPFQDPRNLVRVDSWQTNIDRLGPRYQEIREAVLKRLQETTEKDIQINTEMIWYAGVDGKVEREQIVCSFRRAMGFLHLKSYGEDLYVGWDSHINSGTWMEETLTRGVHRATGKLAVANRVIPGWQIPNEYDVTDVNFLTEWLHAGVINVVRLKMEEYKIDQEIDFTIHRESRKDILSAEQRSEDDDRGGKRNRFKSKLRRVG